MCLTTFSGWGVSGEKPEKTGAVRGFPKLFHRRSEHLVEEPARPALGAPDLRGDPRAVLDQAAGRLECGADFEGVGSMQTVSATVRQSTTSFLTPPLVRAFPTDEVRLGARTIGMYPSERRNRSRGLE